MKQVAGMLLNPLTKFEVVVCCQSEDEEVNPLNLLLHIFRILINHLPSKCECNQDREHGDAREYQGDVGDHFAEHGSNAILRILNVVNAFE